MNASTRTVRRSIAGAALAVIAALGLISPSASAEPADPAAPEAPPPADNAPAATSTTTLPLLGAPVTVGVTTDAGGGLVDVSVAPTGGGAGLTAEPVRPNHVSFVSDDGEVQLRVSAVWGAERITARAGTLEQISGPGGWSGDVFGTGATTDVAFTIGAAASGGPDISGVTVATPHEFTVGPVEYDTGDDRWSARLRIEFSDQGQRRWLTIKAASAAPGEDPGSASVKVSLSHPWGARIEEGEAVGPHSWAGMLCDGSSASVTYNVTAEGRITDVVAVPEADVRDLGRFMWVEFGWGEGVSLFAHQDADGLQVGALDRFHCDRQYPTVDGQPAEQAAPGTWGGEDGFPGAGHQGHGAGHDGEWSGDDERADDEWNGDDERADDEWNGDEDGAHGDGVGSRDARRSGDRGGRGGDHHG